MVSSQGPAPSFRHCSRLATLIFLLAALPISAQSFERPRGTYCSCPPTNANSSSAMAAVAAKTWVDGFLVRVAWKDLETAPGVFDWTLLDAQFAMANASGKKVTLAIMQSFETPTWLAGLGVQSVSYSFAGQQESRPLPWDILYMQRWTSFVATLGARYDSNADLALVHMTHATHNSLEMQLGISAESNYLALGYSDALYAQSWEDVIDAFALAFPTTPLDVDIHPVFNSDAVAQQVVAYGQATLGQQFGVFGGWWNVNNAFNAYPGMYALFQSTAIQSFASAQNVGSFVTTPSRYSNSLQVYEDAFRLALNSGIRYIEVWNADLLDASLEPFLMGIDAELESTGWYQSYDSATTTGSMTLSLEGLPEPNELLNLKVEQAPLFSSGAFVFGLQRNDLALWGFGSLLVGPETNLLVEPCTFDGSGLSNLTFVLGGPITFTAQALAYDLATSSWNFSQGLEIRLE